MSTNTERLTTKFDEALGILVSEDVPETRGVVRRASKRVMNGEIPLLVGKLPEAYTNFTLLDFEIKDTEQHGMGPGIILDEEWVNKGSAMRVSADLIRTLAVLDQYPTKGFERRMALVYDDAILAQRRWLEAVNAPEVTHDPRKNNPRDVTKVLIGKESFYTDAGLADVHVIAREFNTHIQLPAGVAERIHQEPLLDARTFIGIRHLLIQPVHDKALKMLGKNYLNKYTPDQRAEAFATSIFLYSILSVQNKIQI